MHLRRRRNFLFACTVLAVSFGLPQLALTIGAEDAVKQVNRASATSTSTAEQLKAQAEMIKAQAETKKAENDFLRAEAEKIKAQAEAKKVDVDLVKAADIRRQFYFGFVYRVSLLKIAS